jgi:riboflavin transporter FmnP
MNSRTKKLTTMALLCAIAYAVMAVSRLIPPMVLFLQYDPKDIVLMLGGFIWGPLSVVMMSAVVSFLEFATVSDTGLIGLVMNVLSTCAFVCPAAFIYKKQKSRTGAVAGLACGVAAVTAVMLLWNYLITPIYMNQARADIVKMLVPVFLPFNLLKGVINAAATLLLYKPIVTALRKSHILPESTGTTEKRTSAGIIIIALVALVTCVFFILVIKGIV